MKIEHASVSIPAKGSTENEDCFLVDSGPPFFAVVVDAHGPSVPRQSPNFPAFIAKRLAEKFTADPNPERFEEYFLATQNAIEKTFPDSFNGAVAGCVIECDQGFYVVHAGDVRLYANERSRKRTPFARFTFDHNAHAPKELDRLLPLIRNGTCCVIDYGSTTTLWGGGVENPRLHYIDGDGEVSKECLQPTRGFGDSRFRPAFISKPTVRYIPLNDDRDSEVIFALCSDGAHRTVGRTFAELERTNAALHEYTTVFTRLLKQESDDDATVVFFRR